MTAESSAKESAAPHVAVVEDDPRTLRTMELLLLDEGFSVAPFADAIAALESLRSRHFDALVTDHVLPGMQGHTLAQLIRREFPHVRVVVVSGYDAPASIAAEGIPWLIKPVNFDALVKLIVGAPGAR
jgi:CheY-like chemotaxis protein